MNNVLYIDKPIGITSFDVCFKLRKILNTKKIGHTGTLDPNASGVMIVLFDKATKTNQFLIADRKKYLASIKLGIQTDSLDIDGNIIKEEDFILPEKEEITNVLNTFLGKSIQEVPITSAKKVKGKKLYEYQRKNIDVELPKIEIEVYSIELVEIYNDGFSFIVEVSSGTYIRSLARDILTKMNLIGTLQSLRRISINDVDINMCDKLEDVLNGNYTTHSILELLKNRYPIYEYEDIDVIKNGRRIKIDSNENEILIVSDNEALAIYKKDKDDYYILRGLW